MCACRGGWVQVCDEPVGLNVHVCGVYVCVHTCV